MLLQIKKGARGQAGFSNLELVVLAAVAIVLGALVGVSYGSVKQKSHDTERKNDITSLAAQADEYQALSGKYPTPAQLSNPAFMKANLKIFDASILQDPLWQKSNAYCSGGGQPRLETTLAPHRGCYGYAVSPESCDNQDETCTSYTLTARLEAGGYFIKKSVD